MSDHTLYYFTTRDFGFLLKPRDSRSKVTWMKEEEGNIVLDVSDTKDFMDGYPRREGNVLLSGHTVWIFKPLEPVGEIPQTAVSLVTRVDAGGNVPTVAMNHNLKKFLSSLSDLKKIFDKTKEIDAYKRSKEEEADQKALQSLAHTIKAEPQVYDDEEKRAIEEGRKLYRKCKDIKNMKELKCSDDRVEMKMVHVDGEGLGTGIATAIVDAS